MLSNAPAGKYFTGRLLIDGTDYYQGNIQLPVGRALPPGTISDGSFIKTELDGIGASMGPSLIPFATQAKNVNPATWTCSGSGCVVQTGILAPDGTATAGEIDSGTSGNSYALVTNFSTTTAIGDWMIYGAWVRRGANQSVVGSGMAPLWLSSGGATDVFDNSGHSFTTATLSRCRCRAIGGIRW